MNCSQASHQGHRREARSRTKTMEEMYRVGEELGRLFSEDKSVDLTPILRKSKEAARKHRAKSGIIKSGPLGGQHKVKIGSVHLYSTVHCTLLKYSCTGYSAEKTYCYA